MSTSIRTTSHAPQGMVVIYDRTLTADGTFDVTGIPDGYRHLRVHLVARSDRSGQNYDAVRCRFNGDTSSVYNIQGEQSAGGAQYTGALLNNSYFGNALNVPYVTLLPGATSTAGAVGSLVMEIQDYASTNFWKTAQMEWSAILDTSTDNTRDGSATGVWRSTSAVNRIQLYPDSGTNFVTGSRLTIYGVGGNAEQPTDWLTSLDPVKAVYGNPSYAAYEFNSSSLTGLTSIAAPGVENANTTIPGNYFAKDTTNTGLKGRYIAPPSAPYTFITKITADNVAKDYNKVGIGVLEVSSGKHVMIHHRASGRLVNVETYTSLSSGGGDPGNDTQPTNAEPPIYLAVIVTSGTSVAYYWSFDGMIWRRTVNAHNPSFTIDAIFFGIRPEQSDGVAAAFDYFRVWNSALGLQSIP